MSIYKYLSYREIIDNELKKKRISALEASTQIGIHSSYFSRVSKGNADFSADQLFELAKLFEFTNEELDYFMMLGEESRAGKRSHRQFLREKIFLRRKEKLKLKETLSDVEAVKAAEMNYAAYYFESVTAKIHMLLCLPEYKNDFSRIVELLNISKSKLDDELRKLSSLKIISWENGQVQVLKDSIHLDEDDPLSAVNHANWRVEALKNLSNSKKISSDYHCTVNFTSNEETKNALREAFKDFLVKAEKIVKANPSETKICTLCFDIFEP